MRSLYSFNNVIDLLIVMPFEGKPFRRRGRFSIASSRQLGSAA